MPSIRPISFAVIGLLISLTTACTSTPTQVMPTAVPTVEPTSVKETTDEETVEVEIKLEEFDPANFDNPTNIDNLWLPLKPGTQRVYEGSTEDSGFTIPHRLVFTITDLTKVVEGVRTVVAWVEDYSDEELVEAELAFYAQDNDGAVWYLGEYPEEYENGQFVAAPSWIAGFKGAKPGIKMRKEPYEGMPSYSQGWGPAVNWTDYGQVDQMGVEVCVPFECYQDVLVIAESSQDETDAFQLKYYASGVGEVQVGWRGDDATKEILKLVDLVQLDPAALADARTQALNLEKNSFERSKEVYANSSPLEHNQP